MLPLKILIKHFDILELLSFIYLLPIARKQRKTNLNQKRNNNNNNNNNNNLLIAKN